ncbi:MAG TPA: DsbA family protein [Hyphomicrobiaceae bacterium]|nr:DsbA family protein [Hyphomicrobiaceae bacterium]
MSLINAITSPKGAVLLVPAILLVGGTLFIGQKVDPAAPQARAAAPVAAPSQAATTASPPTQPAAAPSAPSQSTAAAPEKPAGGSTFSADQRKELHSIIKEFLLNNPDVLFDAQAVLDARMEKIQSERMAVAMKEFAGELYRPTGSPIVGNVMGDVPIVEFFDYNCGFCKKAFPDVAKLMEKDKKVRVILKEFPILSKGSEEASRVALAAKMQGKYWEFHRAMLEVQGQATEASALRTAEKLGLDMPRIKKDMASAEVKKEIEDTRKLAAKIGIQGTPHFIVGDRVIAGAPENLGEMLDKHVSDVRKEGCKVCAN